ncbi:hypothetical protein G7007_10920 [Pseudomonas entomophila]|uniref:hypothetical protein n=1 Tax=Pseudomonas entomophila TaxID=312306 RepID=UPI0015E3CADA|nr:hypothetical protein [Pseudomonas entomophila]MBA1193373.1 hypothetical protein [Pseudomonas entomophila]
MGFLLVLPILICGFIYCKYNFYDKTLIAKYEGQSLYLHIAMRGIVLTLPWIIAVFLLEWASGGFWGLADLLAQRGFAKEAEKHMFTTLILAIVLGPPYAYLAAQIRFKITRYRHGLKTDYLTRLFILKTMLPTSTHQAQLLDSLSKRRLYMFSMDDRKVYIGWVKNFGNLQDHDSNIDEGFSIIPIYSGFRDKDRLTVEFTTPYEKVYEAIKVEQANVAGMGNGSEDRCIGKSSRPDEIGSLFTISLLQKQIVSMTFFDGDVWKQFKKNEIPAAKDEPAES